MFLGAIADDVTGGTDLASVLRRGGLRVVQTLDTLEIPPRADAVVMSMKTRTVAAAVARSSAGQAAEALRAAGARQIYFRGLLDLRLDGRRQHRTGDRRAVGTTGR